MRSSSRSPLVLIGYSSIGAEQSRSKTCNYVSGDNECRNSPIPFAIAIVPISVCTTTTTCSSDIAAFEVAISAVADTSGAMRRGAEVRRVAGV